MRIACPTTAMQPSCEVHLECSKCVGSSARMTCTPQTQFETERGSVKGDGPSLSVDYAARTSELGPSGDLGFDPGIPSPPQYAVTDALAPLPGIAP